MPRRILFKTKSKTVKAESRGKSKTPFSDLVMPRRILFKTKSKIVKAESRGKSRVKNNDIVAPQRIYSRSLVQMSTLRILSVKIFSASDAAGKLFFTIFG